MTHRLSRSWTSAAWRGFVMLGAMQFATGFAGSTNNSVVTNFFENRLHFTGSEFGYMTAIREFGGLTLILLMALLYRVSIQKLTAFALVFLSVGYALFGVATGFASMIPWILITSLGSHTVLQTQVSLAMSLTTQERNGRMLGRMAAFSQAGTFTALVAVFLIFHFNLLSYGWTFILCGVMAFVGAIAIFRFPHLYEGKERQAAAKREPVVWRKDYRYYYLLNLLDGARQQIFFSFGLWVLVNRFEMGVAKISLLLLAVTLVSVWVAPRVGRLIDRLGERKVLQAINLGYVVALGGYALSNRVYLACAFYVLYSLIVPFSMMGAATYLRKIAMPDEVAPSLAMGVTLSHATAVVVPVLAGVVLNFVGYQVPFFLACLVALVTVVVTQRLNPSTQRSAARIAFDEARVTRLDATERAVVEPTAAGGAQ